MQNNINEESPVYYSPVKTKKRNFTGEFDKKTFKAVLATLVKGILAGAMVAIGCTAYLSSGSKYFGILLFSLSLLIVFSYGFSFFTGKVGYAFVQGKMQNLMLIPSWLGNLIGAFTVAKLLQTTRIFSKIGSRAAGLYNSEMSDTVMGVIVLSFLCGILMFTAADGFKNAKNNVQKYLSVILSSMVFIGCGFNHFTVSAFYVSLCNSWDLKTIWYLILITFGNALGAVVIPLCHKAISKKQ